MNIFEIYITKLSQLLRRKKDYRREYYKEESLLSNKQFTYEHYYDIAHSLFNFYENIKGDVIFDVITDIDEWKTKFKCSLDNEKNTFPLNRVFYYRNTYIPEYLDDYGMSCFLEIFVNGEYHHIDTQYDWDYEVDRLWDVEYLFNKDDGQTSINEKYLGLVSDCRYREQNHLLKEESE